MYHNEYHPETIAGGRKRFTSPEGIHCGIQVSEMGSESKDIRHIYKDESNELNCHQTVVTKTDAYDTRPYSNPRHPRNQANDRCSTKSWYGSGWSNYSLPIQQFFPSYSILDVFSCGAPSDVPPSQTNLPQPESPWRQASYSEHEKQSDLWYSEGNSDEKFQEDANSSYNDFLANRYRDECRDIGAGNNLSKRNVYLETQTDQSLSHDRHDERRDNPVTENLAPTRSKMNVEAPFRPWYGSAWLDYMNETREVKTQTPYYDLGGSHIEETPAQPLMSYQCHRVSLSIDVEATNNLSIYDSPQMKTSPIYDVVRCRENDVLCGRGAPVTNHVGNQFFSALISHYESKYMAARRNEKPAIARLIVENVRQRGGRFMKRVKNQSTTKGVCFEWKELSGDQAYEKTCQSLRDNSNELREKIAQNERRKLQAMVSNNAFRNNVTTSRNSSSAGVR